MTQSSERPREDDALSTPPHGDTLRDRAPNEAGAPASRHGVQLDERGGVEAPRDADGKTREEGDR